MKTTNTVTIWTIDYCDCDERCPKCGKKKRPKYPTITYNNGYATSETVYTVYQ